ncbi:dimethylamine monooxygenase subunit DmmA family protein [Hyphomicrobium sp.]|uniref:dimethylamine monooxygenase subunit DmmA family protein n=1 Tax=Hyphomicrobium sp. TaxID=82 RepID=UPI002D77AB81|nr:dimethylamine monooxygenase subunit DmmA family protein [Hyphomicrobium sp.]HET6390292.1 dimethylamine monooxygenase subunit DmmA family protein [Hyphomicrobium sp.]
MTASTIKSRPIYPGLTPDLNAQHNIIVCDKAGTTAVSELFSRADIAFAERTTIILADSLTDTESKALTRELAPAAIEMQPTLADGIARLRQLLETAPMGMRLYAAGTEPLIGLVVQAGIDFSIDHLSIRTEHRGSLKRRVQCVHCKGYIEDVTTNPVKCIRCGTILLVRDHYSRRLAAFQGVCIDAEVPGDIPAAEALYQ